MGLEWLDEIESELDSAPVPLDWRTDIQRLCRAVRDLSDALGYALDLLYDADEWANYGEERGALRSTLERWRRGERD